MKGGLTGGKYASAAIMTSAAWLVFACVMFAARWHSMTLVSRMLPVIPADLAAAIYKLLSDGLRDLLWLAGIFLAALGTGSLILGRINLDMTAGQRLNISLGIGLAVVSLLVFATGITGHYDAAGLVFLIILLLITAVQGALTVYRAWSSRRGGNAWTGPRNLFLLALIALVAVFLAAKALRPAVFYDAITYHLGVPNYYLKEGGIGYLPYDSFSNFPFMAEMLYTLGMFLSGLKLAQLTSVGLLLSCTALVYDFTLNFVPEVPPALSAALFMLTPAFTENAVLFSNDLYLTYYTLMVVYCLFMLEKSGKPVWAAMAGVFTGVCIGTKYVALVSITVPAIIAVFYIAYKNRKAEGRNLVLSVPMFIAAAVVVASPWLIKNWAYTSNPFYPAMYNVFGGGDMSPRYYAVHTMAANHPTFIAGLKGIFVNLWRLFMTGPPQANLVFGASSFIGPVIIVFAPLLLAVGGVDAVIKKLVLFAATVYVIWNMAFPLTRFLFPAVAVMMVVSAYAVTRLYRDGGKAVRTLLLTSIGACLVFNICLGFFTADQWTNTFGLANLHEKDADYLVRRMKDGGPVRLGSLPAYEYVNANTDARAKVLIIGDAQHLYIDRRHVYAYLSARNPYEIMSEKCGDNKAIAEKLASDGITHIVYNPEELKRLQKGGYTSFPAKDDHCIEEFLESGYVRLLSNTRESGMPVFVFSLQQRPEVHARESGIASGRTRG